MKATREQVEKIFNQIVAKKHFDFLGELVSRWESEKEYEDFAEYEKAIRETMSYLNIVKVTKRPFGIQFKLHGSIVTAKYVKKGNMLKLSVSWL